MPPYYEPPQEGAGAIRMLVTAPLPCWTCFGAWSWGGYAYAQLHPAAAPMITTGYRQKWPPMSEVLGLPEQLLLVLLTPSLCPALASQGLQAMAKPGLIKSDSESIDKHSI